ncbi:MAG: PD40 domain-containing protein [Anaerolineae bacterium]|nr:PD40 domain-containing protein [Anaerolineae bacterium]
MGSEKIGRVIGGVICVVLVGCASTGATDILPSTSTSPAPMENQATAQADAAATLQQGWTSTARVPTSTPTIPPTATPLPTDYVPSVPLSEEGPWLVFMAGSEYHGFQYLWAANEDGTGLTKLVDEPVVAFDIRPSSSVDHATIAYIARTEGLELDRTLKLLSLPDGEVTTITSLLEDTGESGDPWNLYAAIDRDALKWSPGGSLLAFAGMLNGASVDVYTYDFSGKGITRLSDRPSHAYHFDWSPDGRYLVYEGFDTIGMAGADFADMWAAKADGTETIPLIETPEYASVYLKGKWWLSASTIMLAYHNSEQGTDEVHMINLETGETSIALEDYFIAFAPEYNAWLMRPSTIVSEYPLLLNRQGQRQEIPIQSIEYAQWLDDYDVFLVQDTQDLLYTITPDGETSALSFGEDLILYNAQFLLFSPDKKMWAWYHLHDMGGESDLWVGEPMSEPVRILPIRDDEIGPTPNSVSIAGVTWSPDSKRLIVLAEQGVYTIDLPDLTVTQVTDAARGSETIQRYDWQAAWIAGGSEN